MARDRFVTLQHVSDPVQAEMLLDLLEQEGIPATVQGNNHSALLGGLAAAAFRVPLQVPEEDVERAREILAALEDFDEVDPLDGEAAVPDALEMSSGEGPYRSAALEDAVPPRRRLVAVFAALILPMVLGAFGAGHLYVRSYVRGFTLLCLGWTCVIAGLGGMRAAWLGLPVVVALESRRRARPDPRARDPLRRGRLA